MNTPRKSWILEGGQPQAGGAKVKWTIDLERYIPALLVFLANAITNGSSSLLRKNFGVGIIEWRCMSLISIEPWASPNRISQVIGLDKAAVSRSIRALERQQLVEVRSSAQRSRYLEIALTEKGCRLYDRMIQVALERESRLVADVTPEELEILTSVLNRMLRRMPTVNQPVDIPR